MMQKVIIKKGDKLVHDEIVVVKTEEELEKELINIKKNYLLRHPDDYGSIQMNIAGVDIGVENKYPPAYWSSSSSL